MRVLPSLAALVRLHPGLRVPGAWDAWELAVRAVLGQQVSILAAVTHARRITERFGERLAEPDGSLSFLFPGPEALCEGDFTAIGLTRARAGTIRGLARAVLGGQLQMDAGQPPDEVIRRLCAIPGIGKWTAHYIAMRALREPDAFPSGDLGLLRGMAKLEGKMSPASLDRRAEDWRPWRAYAVMYLWTYA